MADKKTARSLKNGVAGVAKGSPAIAAADGIAAVGDAVIKTYKKHVPSDVRKKVRKGARSAWRKAKSARDRVRRNVRKAMR